MDHRCLPALRPGAQVLRRDDHHLQIGTAPGVVIADRPGLLSLLLSLDGSRDLDELRSTHADVADLATLVPELLALGVIVDSRSWRGIESRASPDPERIARRGGRRVAIHDDGGSRALADVLRDVLRGSGVGRLFEDDPDFLVVVSSGEPARGVFMEARRQRLPHLPVRIVEGRVLIGPSVTPAFTPCLECQDRHRADWDRSWAALIPQFGTRPMHRNPPALTALTAHTAAIEAAAVILDHLDGGDTSPLRGGVLAVGPDHRDHDLQRFAFHPHCPCSVLVTGTATPA